MSKFDQVSTNLDAMWSAVQKHVALPPSGPWSYQVEQHRRWHWLDYMMSLGAYPPTEDDWDWVYMLGPYADHANCAFYVDDTGGVVRRQRRVAPSADVE